MIFMNKPNEPRSTSPNKSQWLGFLKSIASFRGDLSSITAPPFLLSHQSIVEFSCFWAEHPTLFVAPALEEDPEKRALAVLRWFLSTLKEQHSSKDENGGKKRMKPLNPFLGEIFLGKWEDEAGTTNLISEQVSHHPPATAFNLWNEKHGVRLQGHIAPKVYFKGTVNIDRKGYAFLHLDKYNEDYLVTMPKIHIEGLMKGSLQPELSGSSYIRCSTGFTAKIDYTSKGWLAGKRNGFFATLFKDGCEKEPLYSVEGVWCDTWTVTDLRTKTEVETFDMSSVNRTPLQVAPVQDQHPLESRKAWRHVVDAIHDGDITAVGAAKSKLENEQREMRKQEKNEGSEWERRYFSLAKEDVIADKLAGGMECIKSEMDGQQGCWMWDEEKFKKTLGAGSEESEL